MRRWLCCAVFMFLLSSGVSAAVHYPVSLDLVQGWADVIKEGTHLSKDVSWAINFSRDRGKNDRVETLTLVAEQLSKAGDTVGLSFDLIKMEETHGFYENESAGPLASMRAYFQKFLGAMDERIGVVNGLSARTSEAGTIKYLEKTRDYLKKVRGLLDMSLEQSQVFVRRKNKF